ncbi:MAG: class I tRNA ligase family protein, partial [Acidobacteria bacterium]|nr:class I tRNA ligase family protein [Acidobacteriota bacterium]
EVGAAGSPEWQEAWSIYLRMLAPACPHIAEELWQRSWPGDSVHLQPFPEVDAAAAKDEEITLVLQVNGKVRDRLEVPVDISREDAEAAALASEAVQKFLDGKPPKKVIVVPGRLVNVVA